MEKKKSIIIPAGIGDPYDAQKKDSTTQIPYASEENIEAARNWVNEHQL